MNGARKNCEYKYIDLVTADVTIEVLGKTLSALFECAAEATFKVMIEDLTPVETTLSYNVEARNNSIDYLLFEWLAELIFIKDSEGVVLKDFQVDIKKVNDEYLLKGIAKGEPLNPEKHDMGVDVKAITMHLFEVKKLDDETWMARFVLDI